MPTVAIIILELKQYFDDVSMMFSTHKILFLSFLRYLFLGILIINIRGLICVLYFVK